LNRLRIASEKAGGDQDVTEQTADSQPNIRPYRFSNNESLRSKNAERIDEILTSQH